MTVARSEIVDKSEIGVYHCVSRCVRRAFLCGFDTFTGRSFEHRRGWIEARLKLLASAFSIDVFSYAVMSNHTHIVLRNRPDLADALCDTDVARRWLLIFGKKKFDEESEPTKSEIAFLLQDSLRLAEARRRLCDISWFMRALNEYVARLANKEDECTGRFWEGRFKCQRLLDDSATLACMTYVDLNPIRAGVAESPETSEFTSVCQRIIARQAREKVSKYRAAKRAKKSLTVTQEMMLKKAKNYTGADSWLANIQSNMVAMNDLLKRSSVAENNITGNKNTLSKTDDDYKANANFSVKYQKNSQAFISGIFENITLDEYIKILDWTGRQLRSDKRGAIPASLAPTLERMNIDLERWVATVEKYGGMFHRVAGKLESLISLAEKMGKKWLGGITSSKLAFVKPASSS